MNISSIIVKTAERDRDAVVERLTAAGLCDIHFADGTKIVVTLEGQDVAEEMDKMKAILNISGVLAADLAYSYSEDETERAFMNLAAGGVVPAALE